MGFSTTIILFVSVLAMVSDAFLFAGMLTRATSVFSLVIAGAVSLGLLRVMRADAGVRAGSMDDARVSVREGFELFFGLSIAAFFKLLVTHPITAAVRTPWAALPREVVLTFGLASLAALGAFAGFGGGVALIGVSVLFFAFLGMTTLAFPLGYGFDSFLHRAAELAVVATGSIQPAPILYGGQYSLVAALHFLTGVGVDSLDRFLVPVLAALVLPGLVKSARGFAWPILFLIPLSTLTISTPFSLATLLFLATVLLCAREHRKERLMIALPVALAACAIHVIAGIPALVVVGLSLLKHPRHLALGVFGGALLVPAALIARLKMVGSPINVAFDITRLKTLFTFTWPATTFRIQEDVLYFAGAACVIVLVKFIAMGLMRGKEERNETLTHLLAAALAFGLSGLLLTAFTLPDVIAYEQADYARRLLLLSVLALTPFAILGYSRFAARLQEKSFLLRALCAGAFALLMVGHFYVLYPRADRHITNKGFNVSENDFLAARIVHTDAGAGKYIVLAPQTTSAAFVREFGFPSTLQAVGGDGRVVEILPYPIPTGGPLYTFFLRVTENLDVRAISDAASFVDVRTAYFMLPIWWWRFEEIKKPLDMIATGSFVVEDVSVWKFERK